MSIINRAAKFNYEILDKYQAGLVLQGHEVKAIKNGQMSLKGSYVTIRKTPKLELFLVKARVSPYKKAGPMPDYDPERPRKLLLQKSEISKLIGKIKEKGLTLVPLKVYNKQDLIKVEIGLAQAKKQYQKKEDKKRRDVEREIRRAMKTRG